MPVDIFIPVIAGNLSKMPAAMYSGLTQTFQDIRMVLFFDHADSLLESFADKWWYTPKDNPRSDLIVSPHPKVSKPLTIEYCERGVIVRNPNGPMGSAGFARQWVFEWTGKSEYVKFLDSDDILTPECLQYMMNVMTPDCAGVICPMVFVSNCRLGNVLGPGCGCGSFLFKSETMDKIVSEGFTWGWTPGHDRSFTNFIREKGYQFKEVTQSVLYLYLKS